MIVFSSFTIKRHFNSLLNYLRLLYFHHDIHRILDDPLLNLDNRNVDDLILLARYVNIDVYVIVDVKTTVLLLHSRHMNNLL